MSLVRYPLPDLKEIKIQNYDLYKCPLCITLEKNINIVFGANGLGKSTLLHIIQYSIIGPYYESIKTRSYLGEQRTRRPIFDRDFFRLRMNAQKEDATVVVCFLLNNNVFVVEHSLYDNILLSVNVNGKSLIGEIIAYHKYEDLYFSPEKKRPASSKDVLSKTLIYAYHNILVQTTGLPDIESLITMLTECMFFTENREFTFWNGDLSNMIISKYFMDQEGYKNFVAEQQNVKQYDSQQRLKTYEISFIRRFLDKNQSSNDCEYTSDDLSQINDELHKVEMSISQIRKKINSYENENIDIRLSIEDIKSQIETLEASWYRAVFPNPYKGAFEKYS